MAKNKENTGAQHAICRQTSASRTNRRRHTDPGLHIANWNCRNTRLLPLIAFSKSWSQTPR